MTTPVHRVPPSPSSLSAGKVSKETDKGVSHPWSLLKLMTAAYGFLAASKGLGVAAARPWEGHGALVLPTGAGILTRDKAAYLSKLPRPRGEVYNGTALASLQSESEKRLLSSVGSRSILNSDVSKTYISNESDRRVVATLTYQCFEKKGVHADFKDRLIKPKDSDFDKYAQRKDGLGCDFTANSEVAHLTLYLKIDTAVNHGTFRLIPDQSVVIFNAKEGDELKVYTAKHGSLRVAEAYIGSIFNN